MAFEKFKPGSEDELHLFLKNFVTANLSKSAYGFGLNRKKPGHSSLCFLTNKNSTIHTWPVRIAPEAYYLFDMAATGVPELCNASKVLGGPGGGRTPYGGHTPGHTPAVSGMAMPGHMSMRHVGGTPNPYVGQMVNPAAAGAATPAIYNGAPRFRMLMLTPFGYHSQTCCGSMDQAR
ncbi:hypothetical protein HETIRDRAFT_422695 [Heterobasidion irregulare TC 32-1]|uniref:Spt6 SH2 domain-containing protein n=1 Tax=Heterobasidion irregulare (strain TC 32-1) TaxID=747525 RepID=W4JSL8_HETIT|nr:uncharacterized protein HETIRDRAFT_422695 [Heterobasidion irregulare TC 32-1]ETW76105.1 hypothetical protein HETIRDRAFT_422695 [Heterobasidion irregulare TC 32-1]